jgi:uncharacterized protein
MKIDESLIKDGLKFQCQGSGKCCTSHGEYGFVFLTLEDRQRFAKHLNITTRKFTKEYCEQRSGVWHLKEEEGKPDCMFLKKKQCTVYEARPVQCRTWPFWSEVLNPKAWKKDVVSFCPGIGKGRLYTPEEIKSIAQIQNKSEDDLLKGIKG